MACGSCGMRYSKQPAGMLYSSGPVRGSSRGVIKKTLQAPGEAIPPESSIPVDGEAGPSSQRQENDAKKK